MTGCQSSKVEILKQSEILRYNTTNQLWEVSDDVMQQITRKLNNQLTNK